jgi:hypothetical protein
MQLYGKVIGTMSTFHSFGHKYFSFSVIISADTGCRWTSAAEDDIRMVCAIQCSITSPFVKWVKCIATLIGL